MKGKYQWRMLVAALLAVLLAELLGALPQGATRRLVERLVVVLQEAPQQLGLFGLSSNNPETRQSPDPI